MDSLYFALDSRCFRRHDHEMREAALSVEHDRHEGGEYIFTPDRLTLSVCIGAPLRVEQVTDGKQALSTARRGDVNVMPAGLSRIFRHRDACDFVCFGIDQHALASPLARPLPPWLTLRDTALRHIAEALIAEHASGPSTRLFQDAAAHAIVARLVALDDRAQAREPAAERGLPAPVLRRVLDYLDAHLASDVSVGELARVAGRSAAHFAMLFRHSVGEPPHRHLVRLRVERARRLLERGGNAADAAAAVGFFDQSHLARHMRRVLGVSPGQLARAGAAPKERPGPQRSVQYARARRT